ncbi:wax ester/triacylglycerol synthase domain-containing protein [Ilumatobacter sp.]|uniref:wax ester/triacylglycerol synthase domain-containing protein n=1 Tax=Ilumatobacter sp. TaxID=1967498 RepID=UPI003B52EA60
MHQLSRRETALLGAESITNLGHYSLYVELDHDDDGATMTFPRLRTLIEEHLHLAPSLRRRLREVPLELDEAWWIEDPHLDLDFHVRHVAVPGAGDPGALEALIGRLHERALDRNRPLWELYLIDLPDDRRGLFIKVHVVLTDTLGPLGPLTPALGSQLDAEPRPPWRPDMVPSDTDLLIKAAWSNVRHPFRSWRRSLRAVQRLPVVGRAAFVAANVWSAPAHPVERARRDQPVPRTSFNRPIGPHRRVARVELPVETIQRVHRELGVRFHDVLLGVISGSLRHWLVVHDELVADPLVALTPLLVDRSRNELGAALVPIATQRHDAVHRVEEISAALDEIAEHMSPRTVQEIRAGDGIPTGLAGIASQMLVTTSPNLRFMPPFNVYVVNVPGDEFTEIDGFPIVSKHALCPIIDGIGLSVSAISLGGSVHVTLVSDRDQVGDLQTIADQMGVELDALSAAVAS